MLGLEVRIKMDIWLFPGQGSQFVGMGNELFNEFPSFVRVAEQKLGFSISELCSDSTEQELAYTEKAQPALFCLFSTLFY